VADNNGRRFWCRFSEAVVNDNVLYHSLRRLAGWQAEEALGRLSEMILARCPRWKWPTNYPEPHSCLRLTSGYARRFKLVTTEFVFPVLILYSLSQQNPCPTCSFPMPA
jgi:hypothetical protein